LLHQFRDSVETDKQKARLALQHYLVLHGLRQTVERNLLLDAIYDAPTHVDAEYLYQHFKDSAHPISKATIYNVLEVLVAADLIRHHQLSGHKKTYEKNTTRQHDHHICLTCQRVTEFCDPRIQWIQNSVGESLGFEIHSHDLTLFGYCLTPQCPHAL